MAARAVAYSEPSCCSDGLQSNKAGKVGEEQEDRRSPVGMDYVRRSVLVEVGTLDLTVAICCVANWCITEHCIGSTGNLLLLCSRPEYLSATKLKD